MIADVSLLLGVALLVVAVVAAIDARVRPRARRPGEAAVSPLDRRVVSGRRSQRRLVDAFPDMLDLIVVALQSGTTTFGALADAARWCPPEHRRALDEVGRRRARGETAAQALDALVEHLGTPALGLVAVLTATERDGLPVAPAIELLADEARQHRRRTAERHARELPVRLSFPLVLCILPSFVLMAIVPLLIGALAALRSP